MTAAAAAAAAAASFEMSPADYQEISKLPGNDRCIDCGAKNTEWGSVSFGILFCAPCSGGHRFVLVSYVREYV